MHGSSGNSDYISKFLLKLTIVRFLDIVKVPSEFCVQIMFKKVSHRQPLQNSESEDKDLSEFPQLSMRCS